MAVVVEDEALQVLADAAHMHTVRQPSCQTTQAHLLPCTVDMHPPPQGFVRKTAKGGGVERERERETERGGGDGR